MPTSALRLAAVDLGASSGRVLMGRVGRDRLDVTEVHRFDNRPVQVGDTLHWDVLGLYRGVLDGLRAAVAEAARTGGPLDGVGIDSWAVDYGLLDETGTLLGNPVHHRDRRTEGVMETVFARVPPDEIYQVTGTQFMPINTLYQLVASALTPQVETARRLLLLPDLLVYWLTGEQGAEVTNASTTQLFDVRRRRWATDLMRRLGLDEGLFPQLVEPGTVTGELLPSVAAEHGLPSGLPVIAVGSHDTASAVVGVPADGEQFAYVSCGTWSLVGVELDEPVLTESSREANFTNELGVDGTVRYLRNVMGLWLLQECIREWGLEGDSAGLARLLAAAAEVKPLAAVVDVHDTAFLAPGDMQARIAEACRRAGEQVPDDEAGTVRCILDSLALAYRRTVREAQQLSGRAVDVVHVVGGGSQNRLLCQLTADACGLPVLAGPVEATAVGNLLVQARALERLSGGLTDLRQLIRETQTVTRYEPSCDVSTWKAAESRSFG